MALFQQQGVITHDWDWPVGNWTCHRSNSYRSM